MSDLRVTATSPNRPDCEHPGAHVSANNCPDCGLLSAHSWATDAWYGPDGFQQSWGGTCKRHGAWYESAA